MSAKKRAECEHKKKYYDYKHAQSDIQGITRLECTSKTGTLVVYKCSFCKCWHVGNDSSRPRLPKGKRKMYRKRLRLRDKRWNRGYYGN